jgi:peptidoglycan-associated lipoprotein
VLTLSACGLPGNVVVLLPNENGTVGHVIVRANGGSADLTQPLAAVGTSPGGPPGEVFHADSETVAQTFAGALAATPRAPKIFIIGFVTDTATIRAAAKPELAKAIATAIATQNADISVVGHADATGDERRNRALSYQRAVTVRDMLVAGGVARSIIAIAYFGSNNPLLPTPRGVPEPRNRRVEVTIR